MYICYIDYKNDYLQGNSRNHFIINTEKMFFRVVLIIISFLCSTSVFSQTTIGIQDFEVVPATPTMTYTGGTISTGNGAFPNAPKFVSGSRGNEVNNSSTNITFSTVNASAYSAVFFTCRLASFAGTSGNGADGADDVIISVSTDGGTTWSQELQISGNSNAKWSFTSGTGIASTVHDGNNVPTLISPAGGGYRTTDGYSTITVTGLPAVANLRVRLEIDNNSGNETWVIDDAEIKGTSSVPCVAPVSQPTNLALSSITSSSMQGSFTGNGADGYLVVASTSPTLSGNPANGTYYNPGDPLGGGSVIYSGTNTTFTANGLSSSTTYYYFIFAFSDLSCSGAPVYNTSSPLSNNDTTLPPPPFSADVVVSEYFNASDPRDEWIELIVVTDNTDMRNWTLRDNNSSTSSWQTAITFRNIAFWNNMRGGTIIKIWNRRRSSSSATIRTVEANKDDGYIELYASHSSYFSGGNFGSSPSYAGSTLNYANGGDILQLRNSSNAHVHALGHDLSPGVEWTNCPTPKVLRNENMIANESVRVVGNTTSNYDAGSSTSNTIVTRGGTGITSGLANDANNELLWRTWREPVMTTQNIAGTICGATCATFTWNKMTDPLPSDDVQGYLIIRKPTAGSFSDPIDGTSYTVGSPLGGGTIVANLDNPTPGTTVTYTDNVGPAGTDEYRIYGYRYTDDNTNGNSFDLARGRAYNITNYVTVTLPKPLPIVLINFTGENSNSFNLLKWTTSSEINNDFFTLEKSQNAISFSEIGIINGAGNSNTTINYQFTDDNITNNTNYYRLKQTDFDGNYSYSNTIVLSSNLTENIFYNPNSKQLEIGDIKNGTITIYNLQGQIVKSIKSNNTNVSLNLSNGMYLISIQTETEVFSKKIIVR